MRPLVLLLLAACASPPPAPAESAPPPVVSVGEAPPVVMTAAIAPAPIEAPKAAGLRVNGDADVPLFTDDPTRGDDRALVTLVVFTDYECPPCKMAVPILTEVQADFGDDAVRLVHKHFPLKFHPRARPAAEAAVAVHQLGGYEAFEVFQRLVFDNQAALSEDALPTWAAEAGVSNAKLRAFLDGPRAAEKVDRDVALAGELEVVGVPDVRINCQPQQSALDASALKAAIVAEQKLAEEALRAGASRDTIYRTRCEAHRAD